MIGKVKVPGEGSDVADIFCVGEAPGQREEEERRPFVGPAGGKLNEFFNRCGISRSDVWLTNASKYRVRGEKDSFFFKNKPSSVTSSSKPPHLWKPTDKFLDGLAELVDEIQRVDPNIIVTFGNYALWALMQDWGITTYHGSVMESRLVPGKKVIPTFHPASVVRGSSENEVMIKWDLDKAKKESKYPEFRYPQREIISLPRASQIESKLEYDMAVGVLEDKIDELLASDHFTCDTEWFDPDNPSVIGFTCSPDWALVVPMDFPGIKEIERLLLSDSKKVFQNAIFDVVYLRKAGFDVKLVRDDEALVDDPQRLIESATEARLIEDTMVEHHVCWPDILNRLENLTAIYTDEPYYKDDRKVWEATGDWETLIEYNGKDCCVTEEVHLNLQSEKRQWGTETAYNLNMLTFDIMARAQEKGIRADMNTLMKIRERNKQEAESLNSVLNEAIGWKINTRSYPQVFDLVYNQLGIRERKRKPTAQETLMDIAAQETDETVKTLLCCLITIRKKLNQNSKYANRSLVDTDGRIRCSWNMAGTKNGRLSASKDKFKGRGASLQTIPDDVRKVFVPDPGCIFLVPDLEQAEARFVAYDAEDELTISWLEQDLDIHKKLAELLFSKPYDVIEKGTRERYLAKTCRHALNYGMGRDTFKMTVNKEFIDTGFGVNQSEAGRLRNQYLKYHGALDEWWHEIQDELARNAYLINPFGRRRNFIGGWGHSLFMDAYAFRPQSTIADLTHIGLWRVDRMLPYAEVLINIHDGSVIQIPENKLEEAAPIVKECLSIPFRIKGREVTIPVEVLAGHTWNKKDLRKVAA